MRRIILGVAVAGVATSVALAVRSQITEVATEPTAASTPHVQAVAPRLPEPNDKHLLMVPPPQEPKAAKPAAAKPVTRPPHVENAAPMQVPTAAVILKRASTSYTKIKTLRADFVQKRENPLLSSKTTARGTIYQKRPDRFLMKFSQPAGDVIVSDGQHFWVYYPSADKRQVLRAVASERGAGGVDLQAQFLGDPVRRFTNTFHGIEKVNGRDAYVLTLVPRTALGYKSIKVWIDTKDSLVRRFILTENNSVVQDYTLANLVLNPPLSNDLFRFTPPADAKIIER